MPMQSSAVDESDTTNKETTTIDQHTSYEIEGKHFEVERVFNDDATDCLGTILLKLIKAEIAPF